MAVDFINLQAQHEHIFILELQNITCIEQLVIVRPQQRDPDLTDRTSNSLLAVNPSSSPHNSKCNDILIHQQEFNHDIFTIWLGVMACHPITHDNKRFPSFLGSSIIGCAISTGIMWKFYDGRYSLVK